MKLIYTGKLNTDNQGVPRECASIKDLRDRLNLLFIFRILNPELKWFKRLYVKWQGNLAYLFFHQTQCNVASLWRFLSSFQQMLFKLCVSLRGQTGEGDMRKGVARTVMTRDDKRQGKRSEGAEYGEENTCFVFILTHLTHLTTTYTLCKDIQSNFLWHWWLNKKITGLHSYHL